MKSLTVQIPQPCPERWDAMQPNGPGRFCASCRKTVVDYTALSDRELAQQLNQASGDVCGRLGADQLDRPLMIPDQATAHWQRCLGVLTMGLLSWQTAQAQSNQITAPARTTTIQPLKPLAIREVVPDDTNQVVVSGRVLIADSLGVVSAVPKATVMVLSADPHAPAQRQFRSGITSDQGIFRLQIPAGWPADEIKINVFTNDFGVYGIHPEIILNGDSIKLGDLVLNEKMFAKRLTITGGSLTIVKSPSRWEQIKGKLLRKDR